MNRRSFLRSITTFLGALGIVPPLLPLAPKEDTFTLRFQLDASDFVWEPVGGTQWSHLGITYAVLADTETNEILATWNVYQNSPGEEVYYATLMDENGDENGDENQTFEIRLE